MFAMDVKDQNNNNEMDTCEKLGCWGGGGGGVGKHLGMYMELCIIKNLEAHFSKIINEKKKMRKIVINLT